MFTRCSHLKIAKDRCTLREGLREGEEERTYKYRNKCDRGRKKRFKSPGIREEKDEENKGGMEREKSLREQK